MNISLTLVVQRVVFLRRLAGDEVHMAVHSREDETRQKVIAEGLAAAAKSEKDLSEAEARSKEIVREARERAAQILDQASKRSNEMIEEAKGTASSEAQRLIAGAREEVTLEASRARESLRREVGELAVEGASRLLGREIDPRAARGSARQARGRGWTWLSEPPSRGPTQKRPSRPRARRVPSPRGPPGSLSPPKSWPIRA